MSSPAAFCPQCKNEVVFLKEGDLRRCPLCGFQFETGRTMVQHETTSEWTFLGTLLRVFLIMVVIVVVAVGVLFLGCIVVLNK
jgi:hypothetical protein